MHDSPANERSANDPPTVHPQPQKLSWRRKTLYSAIVLCCFLACCEVLLRALNPQFIELAAAYGRSHTYDPYLGVRLTPAADERLRLTRHDGSVIFDWRLRVDELGYRRTAGRNPPPRAQRQTPRLIYCIGDSLTMGWGVEFDDSYPQVLGRFLGNGYRVVNLGVDNRGLLAAMADCQRVVEQDRPDIILYLFCANDWEDDTNLLHVRRRHEWQHAGLRAWRACQAHSYLARLPQMLAWYALFDDAISQTKRDQPFVSQLRAGTAQMRAQVDLSSHDYPKNATTTALAEFQSWCQQRKIRLILIVADWGPEHIGMIQAAEALGVEWVGMLVDSSWLIQGDAHLNPLGNRALAAYLNQYLTSD